LRSAAGSLRFGLMPGREKRGLAAQLASYPTFAGCSTDDLEALVDAGGLVTLPAGWPFVSQGEPADACYVLLEGTGRVFLQRREIAQLGPGDIIGEMSFLSGGQRGATVTSSSHVTALRVENPVLSTLVERRPQLKATLQAVYNAHTSSTAQS
jgi:CRP/FNR family transcriptional regulator, cyclic AMP receptor protein